jgi:hypothetical protein
VVDDHSLESADLAGSLVPISHGVYLWQSAESSPAPRRLQIGDLRLERFMDVIMVPSPLETLQVEQIRVVNRLRRAVLSSRVRSATNRVVRRKIAQFVGNEGWRDVIEWGCGYHSLRALLQPFVRLTCVDIDPDVVAWQRSQGQICWNPAVDAVHLSTLKADAIVSVFVFHFRITSMHATMMHGALKADGVLVANVYRRSPASMARLATVFRNAGFVVVRRPDPDGLCVNHEYLGDGCSAERACLGRATGIILIT